jgi:hypothetical protein
MWTMPRPTLQVVAALIVLVAITGLVLGFMAAPERGRLPGESAGGTRGAPINAPDATPIIDAPPPPPPEKTEEEKLAEEKAKQEAEEAAAKAKLVEKAPPPAKLPIPEPEPLEPLPPPVLPPPAPPPPSEIPPF